MEDIADFIKSILEMIPTALKFILWVLLAFLILPCVFVAGTIYPAWSEWGENF